MNENTVVTNVAEVDELGILKASIAKLEERKAEIELKLKAIGPARYAGELYDANVFVANRAMVDWKAIAERVGYTHQLLAAHTENREILTLKVTARK